VFKLLHDVLSSWTPQYWQFWIGLVLVVLVLIGRERMHRWVMWGPERIGRALRALGMAKGEAP
jgi:branched-chain amino acid transport system permease protein